MKPDEIAELLPEVFRAEAKPGTPLYGMLDAMSALHAPDEAILAALDGFFDPRRTPDRFVGFLARWVGLWRVIGSDDGGIAVGEVANIRALVENAAWLSQVRGTARGLIAFLTIATGTEGFTVAENVDAAGAAAPFNLVVTVPAAAANQAELIRRVVDAEKPAHATATLAFPP